MIHTSKGRSSSTAFLVRTTVVIASFAVVGLLVISGSRAVFSGTTDNTANVLGAATVTLTDDDPGTAMFNVSNMVPGQVEERCILVTYSGTVVDPAAVKLYSGGYTDSGNFADFLKVTIDEGTSATFADCSTFALENTIEPTGTLTLFGSTHTNYGNGAGVWDPASTPVSKAYRFTFELDALTPDTEQGESVTALAFTWAVQS